MLWRWRRASIFLPEGYFLSKIFVSYRRSDSQALAGRIADRLIAHFGQQSVFMDVDDIPFGIDFRDHIQSVLSHASVVLAVIGPDWLGIGPDGGRRIDDEDDPVRVEIETALKQNIRLIPVLINNTGMPQPSALPNSMRTVAFINAAPVAGGRDFHIHVERLIKTIERALNTKSGAAAAMATAPAGTGPTPSGSRRMMLAAAALLLVIGASAAWRLGPWNSAAGTSAGATTPAPASQSQNAADPGDEEDWATARAAKSFEAYKAYVQHHPQGAHIVDARTAAISGAAQAEPPIGALPTGETVLVDDRVCGPAQIKAVTGGDVTKQLSRVRKCVSRGDPF
jgi:hypothetical protein